MKVILILQIDKRRIPSQLVDNLCYRFAQVAFDLKTILNGFTGMYDSRMRLAKGLSNSGKESMVSFLQRNIAI